MPTEATNPLAASPIFSDGDVPGSDVFVTVLNTAGKGDDDAARH